MSPSGEEGGFISKQDSKDDDSLWGGVVQLASIPVQKIGGTYE